MTNSRHEPTNVNHTHRSQLGTQDRIALVITGAVGTMYAVYLFALFMVVWMLWQAHLSGRAFDPYPFAFLLFLGNIVQLLLMPLIMVGQNLQGRHAELRAEEEFKTTRSTYRDIGEIIERLERIEAQLTRR